MSFARDKLYNGYLRRNMAIIASNVKAREIMPHLPCLTSSDREEIEAKREISGNYVAMMHLLDCLRKRQNWPEEFIAALEKCEQTTMAAEIRAEYNSLTGLNSESANYNPPSPPTTVITAHVHPAPSASHLVSTPESGGNSQAAVAPLFEASAPAEPVAQASPPSETPLQPEAPPSPDAQAPMPVSSSEPVQQFPQSSPSTPPPSPEISHHQATTPPPPQRGIQAHQEPEENSETDLQDGSDDTGLIPDKASAEDSDDSVNSDLTPEPGPPVEQCETTAASQEVRAPQSLSPTQTSPAGTDSSESIHTMMTTEKPPVQETIPPVDTVATAILEPEEPSEPAATQVFQDSQQAQTTDTTAPPTGINVADDCLCDNEFLSKPGQLLSFQQQNHDSPSIPAPSSEQEPYSGNSEHLEISEPVPDPHSAAQVPACSAVVPACRTTASPPPCQENGTVAEPLPRNGPEENHYESPCKSLEDQEVFTHVVQVAEEPSIQDQDGQTLNPQILNGQAVKEPASAPPPNTADAVSYLNATPDENCCPSASAPELQVPEEKTRRQSPNTKYVVTAAAVGVCALVMAWRMKH